MQIQVQLPDLFSLPAKKNNDLEHSSESGATSVLDFESGLDMPSWLWLLLVSFSGACGDGVGGDLTYNFPSKQTALFGCYSPSWPAVCCSSWIIEREWTGQMSEGHPLNKQPSDKFWLEGSRSSSVCMEGQLSLHSLCWSSCPETQLWVKGDSVF